MVLICKKSEFILCQVCPQDDQQTAFTMLVFRTEFDNAVKPLTAPREPNNSHHMCGAIHLNRLLYDVEYVCI